VHVLIVGDGPSREGLRERFQRAGLAGRLHLTGSLIDEALADAYGSMDVFAFASHSETQGMVLTEAMAAGVPVVAVDAPGAREVVRDGVNGRLLARDDCPAFALALRWVCASSSDQRRALQREARQTARRFSMERTARRALDLYERLRAQKRAPRAPLRASAWQAARRRVGQEWRILANRAEAARHAWSDQPGRI
jgi:glycosyltransferase involved in cell wall biosynthesis